MPGPRGHRKCVRELGQDVRNRRAVGDVAENRADEHARSPNDGLATTAGPLRRGIARQQGGHLCRTVPSKLMRVLTPTAAPSFMKKKIADHFRLQILHLHPEPSP